VAARAWPFILGVVVGVLLTLAFVRFAGSRAPEGEADAPIGSVLSIRTPAPPGAEAVRGLNLARSPERSPA
jgi:hypothetical protein